MAVRVTYRTGGYPILHVDGDDVEDDAPRERGVVHIHRLAGVAWGILDGLDQEVDVHHVDGVPSNTSESNLDALQREDHSRVTRASQDAQTAQETVGIDYGLCGSCDESRPLHVRPDDSRRCVMCRTVVDVEDVDGRADS